MAMAEAPLQPNVVTPVVEPAGDASEGVAKPALSWAEQEVLDALKRLARAQAQMAALEARTPAPPARSFDPEDVRRAQELQGDLERARAKASGRFAKGAARERLEELQMRERLLLDRLRMASLDELRAAASSPAPVTDPVDPNVLAFARQELAAAQQGWLDVQALELPSGAKSDPETDPQRDLSLERAPQHAGGPDVA
jgi:hypothetical protein